MFTDVPDTDAALVASLSTPSAVLVLEDMSTLDVPTAAGARTSMPAVASISAMPLCRETSAEVAVMALPSRLTALSLTLPTEVARTLLPATSSEEPEIVTLSGVGVAARSRAGVSMVKAP